MKVLMFGWEFPPHISGGLGTACFGLTKGMSTLSDMEVLFVVPKSFGDEDQQTVKLLGANEVDLGDKIINYSQYLKKINFIQVESQLVPYTSPEEYEKLISSEKTGNKQYIHTKLGGKIDFTG
jgi:hypothetical protein